MWGEGEYARVSRKKEKAGGEGRRKQSGRSDPLRLNVRALASVRNPPPAQIAVPRSTRGDRGASNRRFSRCFLVSLYRASAVIQRSIHRRSSTARERGGRLCRPMQTKSAPDRKSGWALHGLLPRQGPASATCAGRDSQ